MTEQTTGEERTPNNVLTAAEMFRLTIAIQQRAAAKYAAVSWRAAEEVFSTILGRTVTGPNILTALSALDDVTQSHIIKPRGPEKHAGGDFGSKLEGLDGRVGRLVATVGTLGRLTDERFSNATGRVNSIYEVLAREGGRIDLLESRRLAHNGTSARHDREIRDLKKQTAELAQLVTRLEQRVGTFERPFALNSGGDFHDGLPAGGRTVNVGDVTSE